MVPDQTPYGPVRRISRIQRGWRIAVLLIGVVLLFNGSLRMSDDVWPFGPMSQYAFTKKIGDTVVITRVRARLADGSSIELPLTAGATGISRAEIEAQTTQIEKDPALLSSVVDGWNRNHPGGSRPVEVFLVQDQTIIEAGGPVKAAPVELARWAVPR